MWVIFCAYQVSVFLFTFTVDFEIMSKESKETMNFILGFTIMI